MPAPPLDNDRSELERLVEGACQERNSDRRDELVWQIAQHDRDARVGAIKQLVASDDRDAQMLGADVVAATPYFKDPDDRSWAKEQGLAAADVEPFNPADRDWLARVLSKNLEQSQDPDLVHSWVKAVGAQRLAGAIDAVVRHTSDADEDVRMASAVALGDLTAETRASDQAVQALLLLARDPVDDVRNWALFGLGRSSGIPIDTPEVRAVFNENATHPDDDVREEAIRALALLGDIEMLETALVTYELDLDLLEMARRIGTPRLHQPLLQLLANTSQTEPSDREVSEHVREILREAIAASRPPDGELS